MYRLMFIVVVLAWLTAMYALFQRDIRPAWTAQDPPPMTAGQFAGLEGQEQFGIFDGQGHRIGRAWGEVGPAGGLVVMTGTVLLDGLPQIQPIRIETETQFDAHGELDSFDLNVFGVYMTRISVHGERRGIYFPCDLKIGPLEHQANLDVSASRMIGDSIRPFNALPKLRVGQSWRMQLLDPVSAVLKMSKRAEFKSVVARVTHREPITTAAGPVDCFVVEIQDQGKAWVDDRGRVLQQVVNSPIPMIGRLTIKAEEYDQDARRDAKNIGRSTSRPSNRGRHGGGN